MSKYLICINPNGTELEYGETYLCLESHGNTYVVFDYANNFQHRVRRNRFVEPQEFDTRTKKVKQMSLFDNPCPSPPLKVRIRV